MDFNLNHNQDAAVNAGLGPIAVIAGAGTGKTRVLTTRIAFLIEHMGFKPHEVLAITFTNKAANEMKNRIRKLLPSIIYGNICTFHSLCLRILKEDISILNRSLNFRLIDDEEQETLISEIIFTNNLRLNIGPGLTSKKVRGYISDIKRKSIDVKSLNDLKKIREYFSIHDWNMFNAVKNAYLFYEEKMQENNLLDFDDLIINTIKVFEKDATMVEKWRNVFKYVLVDEFQDTDKNQLTILKYIINPDFNNVFVVGDEDQTIYTWRGAYPQIFHDFYKTFDNAQTFVLNLNYRSCKKILHLSNELIKKNTRRVDKQLITDNDDGADIVFYQGQNEGEFVVNKIVELMKEQHFNYSDFAILYRSNYLSRNVETSLINKSIPYYMYGGIKFYQRKEIKDMIAYLRLFEDHTDELALKRVINVPRRNIGLTTIQKIVDYATRYHLRFSQALELSADLSYNLPWPTSNIVNFLEFIVAFKKQTETLSISEKVLYLLDKLEYRKYLEGLDDDYQERYENIEEFINSIKEFELANPNATIHDFLTEIALYTDSGNKQQQKNTNTVSLMTIHTAKGTEYPVVFIMGMNEGITPATHMGSCENLDEERRILYVGITRARKMLFLSRQTGFSFKDNSPLVVSRFIGELGKEHIIHVSEQATAINSVDMSWFDSHNKVNYEDNYDKNAEPIEVGQTIVHTTYGQGLVVDKIGNYIEVLFKSPHGKKTIVSNHKSIKRLII